MDQSEEIYRSGHPFKQARRLTEAAVKQDAMKQMELFPLDAVQPRCHLTLSIRFLRTFIYLKEEASSAIRPAPRCPIHPWASWNEFSAWAAHLAAMARFHKQEEPRPT